MKKGFTLVELLAVIIIISITSMIIFPNITRVINDSKVDLYNSQITDIQLATEKWASEHLELLDDTHSNDIYISLQALRFSGYLEPDEIKNPKDKSTMNGCIRVRYNLDNKKYNYIYEEKKCPTYASESNTEDEYGYIIYSYDKSSKQFQKEESSKEVVSTGKFIVDNNLIRVVGQTDSGLYDMGTEYVFKGNEVNNYVTLTGNDDSGTRSTSWRILSINKSDYSVKLISANSIASNVWDSNGSNIFKNSTIDNLLLSKVDDNGIAYNNSKIINNDFEVGKVVNSEFSIDALKSELSSKTTEDNISSQKVGTISVLDYVNASANTACNSNYLSDSCNQNNYLKDMFGSTNTTWTLNTDGNQVWYISATGNLGLANSTDNKQIYAVVRLSSNTHITNTDNGTGASNNPFVIK